jgi:hypothetical protein
MRQAVVIGNGESRRGVDLESYKLSHTVIGCNALHRDLVVEHLVCCDRRMAAEATENIQTKDTLIYVRSDWFHYFRKIKKNKNIRVVPTLPYIGETKKDKPDHWGSGVYAILLAACLEFDTVEIIGFDLYSTNQMVNNIYKDTNNYSNSTSHCVDPSFWIYQIFKIFIHYPNTQFIIRNRHNWIMPTEWQKKNVSFVAL